MLPNFSSHSCLYFLSFIRIKELIKQYGDAETKPKKAKNKEEGKGRFKKAEYVEFLIEAMKYSKQFQNDYMKIALALQNETGKKATKGFGT